MLYVDMIQAVLARAKGCPEDEAVDAMRNACMEFCEETYWLTTGTQVTLDGTEVPLVDLDTRIVNVLDAYIDGEQILVTFLNDPEVDELEPGKYALQLGDMNNGTLTPAPTGDAPVTLDLLVAIAPGPESTEVPDTLWQTHSEALKSGALSRLLAEPGKSWSNPQGADYHAAMFAKAMTKAAAFAGLNRQTVARRLRVKPV